MHVSLIDRPFVPHNLMSTQESPVPLIKLQMAPRLKILMASGSKKGTEVYVSFSLKSPGKWTPSSFSNRAPMERYTHLQGICISLENLIKIPLDNKGPKERSALPHSPKVGPLWKQTPIFKPCLTYLLGSPVKEPSLKVPFMESLAERCPTTRALPHLSKSPVCESSTLHIPVSPHAMGVLIAHMWQCWICRKVLLGLWFLNFLKY